MAVGERTVEINGVEVRCVGVSAAAALSEWQAHRANTGGTGLYPLIVIEETIESLEELGNGVVKPEDRVSAAEWLEQRQAQVEEMMEEDSLDGEIIRGEFTPSEEGKPDEPQLLYDVNTGREQDLSILLVPCKSGAEAMEVIGYGGWNDCPEPAAHGAMMRRWFERYGAEPIALGPDTVECIVKRPPTSEKECMDLAWEQYLYCADVVEQGCDTVGNLAGLVQGCRFWFFWWD
jgi:hypothetical protein